MKVVDVIDVVGDVVFVVTKNDEVAGVTHVGDDSADDEKREHDDDVGHWTNPLGVAADRKSRGDEVTPRPT